MELDFDLEKLRALVNDAVKSTVPGKEIFSAGFIIKSPLKSFLLNVKFCITHYLSVRLFNSHLFGCCVVNYNTCQETPKLKAGSTELRHKTPTRTAVIKIFF
jgi:hypothetical protein